MTRNNSPFAKTCCKLYSGEILKFWIESDARIRNSATIMHSHENCAIPLLEAAIQQV